MHDSGIVDDKAILSLAFDDGSIGTLVYCGDSDKSLEKEYFEAFGSNKSIVLKDFKVTEFYAKGKKTVFKTRKRDKGFEQEITAFLGAIKSGERSPHAFASIRAASLAAIYAQASIADGRCYNV